jgi:hypothetical protein
MIESVSTRTFLRLPFARTTVRSKDFKAEFQTAQTERLSVCTCDSTQTSFERVNVDLRCCGGSNFSRSASRERIPRA